MCGCSLAIYNHVLKTLILETYVLNIMVPVKSIASQKCVKSSLYILFVAYFSKLLFMLITRVLNFDTWHNLPWFLLTVYDFIAAVLILVIKSSFKVWSNSRYGRIRLSIRIHASSLSREELVQIYMYKSTFMEHIKMPVVHGKYEFKIFLLLIVVILSLK